MRAPVRLLVAAAGLLLVGAVSEREVSAEAREPVGTRLPRATGRPEWPSPDQRRHAEKLYQEALALENSGRNAEAINAYVRAVWEGSGKAALRLGEIYDKGLLGVKRDYPESLKWYNAARVLGEDVPLPTARP